MRTNAAEDPNYYRWRILALTVLLPGEVELLLVAGREPPGRPHSAIAPCELWRTSGRHPSLCPAGARALRACTNLAPTPLLTAESHPTQTAFVASCYRSQAPRLDRLYLHNTAQNPLQMNGKRWPQGLVRSARARALTNMYALHACDERGRVCPIQYRSGRSLGAGAARDVSLMIVWSWRMASAMWTTGRARNFPLRGMILCLSW